MPCGEDSTNTVAAARGPHPKRAGSEWPPAVGCIAKGDLRERPRHSDHLDRLHGRQNAVKTITVEQLTKLFFNIPAPIIETQEAVAAIKRVTDHGPAPFKEQRWHCVLATRHRLVDEAKRH